MIKMELKEYRIQEICEIKSGKRIPLGFDFVTYPTPHPYIRARDIKNGHINTDDLIYLDDITYNKIKKYIINENDVAITIVGASVGDVGFAQKNVDGFNLTENAVRLTNFINSDSKYVFYLLAQKQYKELMLTIAGGAAQPKLGIYKIQKIKLVLPPLPTQQKIASILSCYDYLIQNYKKQIEALQTAASELYKEWFVRFRFPGYQTTKFENGIPLGWKEMRLDEISNVVMGQSPESCYYNDERKGLPFHQGAGSYGELYLIDDVYSTEGLRIAEPGSIIFSVRAPVGKLNITLNKIILGRGVAAINSKNDKNGFLYWTLKSKFSKEDMIGNGSVFASVTKDELLKQKFLIPSDSILNKYDEVASNIERRMRSLYQQITNLTQQRDLLLPRLMSGKLEV